MVSVQYHNSGSGPIPKTLRKDLTFSPFVLPSGSDKYTASSYKFTTTEDKVHVLSYVIRADDGTSVSVSEYPQPSQFTDIPEYKDRFLTNVVQQYDSVQTSNGTIYLGKLSKDNNRQLGVMLERGLLVLMSPDKDLKNTQWHSIGEQLEIQKVIN